MEEEVEEEVEEEEEEKEEEEEEEEEEEDNQGADEEKMTIIVHKNTHLGHTQHKMSIQAMGISRLMNNAH